MALLDCAPQFPSRKINFKMGAGQVEAKALSGTEHTSQAVEPRIGLSAHSALSLRKLSLKVEDYL